MELTVDPMLVEDSKIALKRVLQKKHEKLATLRSLAEEFKNGLPKGQDEADRTALFEVLEELNGKEL